MKQRGGERRARPVTAGGGMTRRRFLAAGAGAGLVATRPRLPVIRPRGMRGLNVVVLMTDQERFPAHWPAGWAEQNLPAMRRLQRNGLTFNRAYTAAAECSPSRAVMLTSEHAKVNQVAVTLKRPGLPTKAQLTNVASLLQQHTDYLVAWKGKWHLSYSLEGNDVWTAADIAGLAERFGPLLWNPPDAGTAVDDNSYGISTMGGGLPNNDGRYVMGPDADDPGQTPGFGGSVLDFLAEVGSTPRAQRRPFCLFVSLVNPHDVSFFPDGWEEGGYRLEDFADLGIPLPGNANDDLLTKPSVQRLFRDVYDASAPLDGAGARSDYVNFYAYLHKVVDQHVGRVLDALDEWELTDDTIVLRLADHGEMGLSHGLRQKSYTAYEETIHVPLIAYNPRLYPAPISTDAFYCHLDLMPTIADLAGIRGVPVGRGVSVAPVLSHPHFSVQDGILFTFDDVFNLPADVPGGHIRALRTGDWTYAVYFDLVGGPFEYELYDLASDPGQLDNLVFGSPPPAVRAEWNRLHAQLTARMLAADAMPDGLDWPVRPAG
ncbi:MAG: sulfatase-like hydrolase/transferase [Thermodesulfobacteriota bacterium]